MPSILPIKPTPGPEDIAIVFPGGGAWIYSQASALDTILTVKPDLVGKIKGIYCNSAGTISGSLLASGIYDGVGTASLMSALAEIKQDSQVITPSVVDVMKKPLFHPLDLLGMIKGALFGVSVVDQQPLWNLLEQRIGNLTTDDLWVKCGIRLQARGFDSAAGMGRVYEGELWMLAALSSAIELVFRPFKGISDGGPVDNCPADLAIQAGFKRILVVYCGPEGPLPELTPVWIDSQTPAPTPPPARQVAGSLLANITQLNESVTDRNMADWSQDGGQLAEAYPAKDTNMGSILDFSIEAQGPRVAAGIAAGKLALERIASLGW